MLDDFDAAADSSSDEEFKPAVENSLKNEDLGEASDNKNKDNYINIDFTNLHDRISLKVAAKLAQLHVRW